MKTIKIELSERGIDKMIKEIQKYEKFVNSKVEEFLNRLTSEGARIAQMRFDIAFYDGDNDVKVEVEKRDETTVAIVATGMTTLFIEFGTGITYPHDNPDPVSAQYPAGSWSDGEFGKGHWDNPHGWWYGTGADGGKPYVHTRGNPANLSMYNTKQDLIRMVKNIAEEVFKYD